MKFRYLLYPFGLIYGLILAARNKIFDLGLIRPIEFDIPVIGIGNLEVGGSGKTPHIVYLIDLLKDEYNVAVLSRGYGRKTKGFVDVTTSSVSQDVGDESLMIKKKFPDIAVTVCENRPLGIAQMLQHYPATDVVLLDDAFQHRYIKPGFSILLSSYGKPFFMDLVLPAGNLREFRYGYKRADLVVFSKSPSDRSKAQTTLYRSKTRSGTIKTTFTSLKYTDPILVNGPETEPVNAVVVTGIANPVPLMKHLDERFAVIKHLKFGDHHRFNTSDVREMVRWLGKVSPCVMITTAKDWVKLEPLFSDLSETSVFVQDISVEPYDDVIENEVRSFIRDFDTGDE